MDSIPPVNLQPEQDKTYTQGRRNSLINLPYDHNLDLEQLFDTCRTCITAVTQLLQFVLNRPVLSRRLDTVDESFKTVSAQFTSSSKVPDRTLYLLVVILKEVYELLRHQVETNYFPISNVEISAPEGIVELNRIPHGQVQVSIEKLVENLKISVDETEKFDEYIYRIRRQIRCITDHTSPLERFVEATEMWTDQLVALAFYTFPHRTTGLADSVRFALDKITLLLEMKDSRTDSPVSSDDGTTICKSETFFWRDLNAGGDGFGKIYKIRAKDSLSPQGDFYACKVIRQPRNNKVNLERKAILAVCNGQHPNIIEMIDTWTERTNGITTCYIQMELCKGDLHYFLRRRYTVNLVPLTYEEIWEIFRQIISGIGYIHSLGMVHRDIKPKNILFTTDANSNLAWKITDFGFSAMAGVSLPKPLSMGRMTRNYLAPELLISSRYDGKVDIWSAGCILYELATGCPAFLNDEAVRKYAWSGSHVPLVADNRAGLGVEIEERVGEMLNISPEMRPDATTVLKNIPVESSPIC